MPELGFHDQISAFRARDVSPDSVIFTADSNLSIFSSASASVDRCSFASDSHDHEDPCLSDTSQPHLAGHELHEASRCPASYRKSHNVHLSKRDIARVQIAENSEVETEDDSITFDSARNSFSQALKECQDRRSRNLALLHKPDRRRHASLDLNSSVAKAANSSSPRFGGTKKAFVTTPRAGVFPSPYTPNYRHSSVGIQKGWSSERVPLHSSANRRQLNNALLPYYGGRTLPSKWEDAERWIFSPLAGDAATRTSLQQPQRRPKSKSGPLGPPGAAYCSSSLYSPAMPLAKRENNINLVANSPFSTRVGPTNDLSIHCGSHGVGDNFTACTEPCMARSLSINGFSELLSLSSLPAVQDEGNNDNEFNDDAASNTSGDVLRRDMVTQMSPDQPDTSPQSSFSPPLLPIVEVPRVHSFKAEVRDVPIDERVTVTRWSKKQRARIPSKSQGGADEWRRKAVEVQSEVSETENSTSKIKREENKITAWENLQKAKAEAAIRNLEMKLEKKRSSSMDKIMNKLRSAQKKAQEMRSSMSGSQGCESQINTQRALSFRRTRQVRSFSGCFTCHAF
ncbi:unnamed protein product [Cuscuta campestris]|uniref:Remorin C-terminal domain-containing protein n=1 Tax=Cuscuta campestris TaxID=132261 RepID=A0A484KGN0_9ASTE|nr:unnamed protein product [Cuscuta campestris]